MISIYHVLSKHLPKDVIWNLLNMGFPPTNTGGGGYKQTFTVITSQCTTDHNRLTNMFDIHVFMQQHAILTKFVCTPRLAGKAQPE